MSEALRLAAEALVKVAKPRFITFTGFDDYTSITELSALADEYPIELGVLFSPVRQGAGRYPPADAVHELLDRCGSVRQHRRFALSAHLCGGHSRDLIIEGGAMDCWLDSILGRFDRVQVNTTSREVSPAAIRGWAREHELEPILQYRGDIVPVDDHVSWLFDASGGRGLEPDGWPHPDPKLHATNLLKGYAGGLRPQNVARHVRVIGARDGCYWIDMESGVRDARDRFDLGLCRKVCEAVYG